MKKALVLLPVVAALSACGTFGSKDIYDQRSEKEQEQRAKLVERSLDKAPKWMTELPKSTNAVYANGTAVSISFNMADEKAKTIALGNLCMSAGGEIDKSSKVYQADTTTSGVENSELAIRSLCRRVDVTGAEVFDIKRVEEGGRYRTYVLMALPMGDANTLRKNKLNEDLQRSSIGLSREAFKELDQQISRPKAQ